MYHNKESKVSDQEKEGTTEQQGTTLNINPRFLDKHFSHGSSENVLPIQNLAANPNMRFD
jgi:hypothetical protein